MFSIATRVYIQFSDTRLRLSSPRVVQPYECIPFVAIEVANGKESITAIGRDAEALKGRSNIRVVNPFGHPRMVVDDFTVGAKLLQHALRSFLKDKGWVVALEGIMHPERPMEGGLTQIEYRAVRELCENAGCRKSAVHEGRALAMDEVKAYEMRT